MGRALPYRYTRKDTEMMLPCPALDHALEEGAVVASAVSGMINASPARLDVVETFMLAVTVSQVAGLLALGSLRMASVTRRFPIPDPHWIGHQRG